MKESFEEYVKREVEDDLYGWTSKSNHIKRYDEIELQFIREMSLEEHGREPTEQEIEKHKTELTKLKYLVDSWIDEYFEKVEKEHEATKKARESEDSQA